MNAHPKLTHAFSNSRTSELLAWLAGILVFVLLFSGISMNARTTSIITSRSDENTTYELTTIREQSDSAHKQITFAFTMRPWF